MPDSSVAKAKVAIASKTENQGLVSTRRMYLASSAPQRTPDKSGYLRNEIID